MRQCQPAQAFARSASCGMPDRHRIAEFAAGFEAMAVVAKG